MRDIITTIRKINTSEKLNLTPSEIKNLAYVVDKQVKDIYFTTKEKFNIIYNLIEEYK